MINKLLKKDASKKRESKKNIFSFMDKFLNKKKDIHILETIYIASMLSMVCGYVDAYTYITKDGIFAYAQTGNIIFLAMNLAKGNFYGVIDYLFPILSFICGIWFAQFIKKITNGRHIMEWGYIILLINTIIFFMVGLFSKNFPNALMVSSVSFISAVHMSTFNKVEGLSYVSTLCTGNLRSASEHLFNYFFNKNKNKKEENIKSGKNGLIYLTVILSFTFGAYLGSLFTNKFGTKSVWIAAGVLMFVNSFMFFEEV